MASLINSASYLANRFLFARDYLVGRSTKYNLKLRFKAKDAIGRTIFKSGLYEEEISSFLIQKLPWQDNDIVLDVGANIGWYSLLLASQLPQQIQIFAFEPEPDNFRCLQYNLEKNKISTVAAYQQGISDKTETKTLHLYKNSNTGRHSMLDINDANTIEVQTTSLDSFLAENQLEAKRVKLMKIDIEGFEYFAFKGARQLLDHLPYIMAEFSPGYMRKGGLEPAELLELLYRFDYVPYQIQHEELNKVASEALLNINHNLNLLWIKRGHEKQLIDC